MCQLAQKKPSTSAELTGFKRRCNRGRAKPRQPGSSPSGPPTRLGVNRTSTCTRDDHCHRSMPDLVIKNAAVNAATSTADAPTATPITRSERLDQIRTTFQLRSKIRCVTSAATVGPKVPIERKAGGSLFSTRIGIHRTALTAYASGKYVASSRSVRLRDSAPVIADEDTSGLCHLAHGSSSRQTGSYSWCDIAISLIDRGCSAHWPYWFTAFIICSV